MGADICDGGPVRHASVVALLLACAAVDGQHGRAGRDNHARVREGALGRVEDSDFCGNGDGKILVEGSDEGGDEVPVFLEEGAISAFTRDALWAAEVQINGVTVRGDESRGGEEVWRGVGAELDERRAVRGAAVEEGCLKGLCTVGRSCSEEAGVEHGGIAEGVGGGVPAGEETPGLVGGCQYVMRDEVRARGPQTYSDCSTMGATMVVGEPIDS